jgi:tripartite-type tricarboxylate transporter receptor subunit TctC
MRRSSSHLFALAFAIACGLAGAAAAQSYPVKPIRLVVGTAPGGGSDFVARLLASRLTEPLGQQVIVENRSGAGSTLGYEFGMRAAPDGYTLTLITGSYAINPSLYPVKFDPVNDYTPIIAVARGPYVMVVHPALPVKNVRDLIALAKARPGQIIYGSSGQGAIVHLTTELFLYMAGITMTHVPYKGGGLALTEVIAGQIQVVFATTQTGLAQAKTGRVRALAVTTPERIIAAPDLPTIAEAGVPGYEVTNWHALIGPKGLPRALVDRLNAETAKILSLKDMEERMQTDGVSPAGGTPEQLHRQVVKEIEQWRQVVTRAGIKIN